MVRREMDKEVAQFALGVEKVSVADDLTGADGEL